MVLARIIVAGRANMPINPDSLGARASLSQQVDTRWVLSYAAGLGLSDPLFLDDSQPDGPCVVPMFCVCLEWEAALKARNASLRLSADELRQAVHAWQRSAFKAPIRAGMTVSTSSEVVYLRRTSAGTYVVMRYLTSDQADGSLLTDSLSGSLFRGVPMIPGAPDEVGVLPALAATEMLDATPLSVAQRMIEPTYPHVYTECARIWNPIHTEQRVARAAGLSNILLHGTATWALAAVAIARMQAGGDRALARLELLEGQFKKPVPPGDTLNFRALSDEPAGQSVRSIAFDALTGTGQTAISAGRAQFAQA